MKRIAWLTDLHLNFLTAEELCEFLEQLANARADTVLISGDIAESRDVTHFLQKVADAAGAMIYFVLGNHDFYFSSIRDVRANVSALCRQDPRLVWLNEAGVVELTPQMGLVGHDGWADARLGDYERSHVMMNDYVLIEEFAGVDKEPRWPLLKAQADESADAVRKTLPVALDRYPRVLLVTHVPPFRDACWHEGKISDDEWLPHFTSQAMGDAILEIMRSFPRRELTVLCGHTHGRGEAQLGEHANIQVLTGGAEYGAPEIQRIFEFS
jgi:predicted MPP superfamily phosphohydrolase